jgi:hypothetical protein
MNKRNILFTFAMFLGVMEASQHDANAGCCMGQFCAVLPTKNSCEEWKPGCHWDDTKVCAINKSNKKMNLEETIKNILKNQSK